MNLVFDIEGNGLLDSLTDCWMIIAQEVGTDRQYIFSDHTDKAIGGIKQGLDFLSRASMLSGHNIYGYDLPALKQLYGWEPDYDKVKIVDTLILSWMYDYKAPQRKGRHGLGAWGEFFKFPKGDFHEFHQYSDEMLEYCKQDVKLNEKVFQYLAAECKKISEKKPLFKLGMKHEHRWAYYEMRMREKGWLFDLELANESVAKWGNRMREIEAVIHPQLRMRVISKNEVTEDRVYRKDGGYYKTALQHLVDDPKDKAQIAAEELRARVAGPYTKVEFIPAEMGQMDNVKEHLKELGWQPDDWNVKPNPAGFGWIQTTPKLTPTSMKALDEKLEAEGHEAAGIGAMVDEYYGWRSRKSVVEGWLKAVKGGRLHPRTWTIGTPTFRCRHEVIANLPGVHVPGGKELRSMLIAEEGYKVVGADSSGNQFRALAHYVKDDDFTASILHGSSADGTDVHSRNAKLIGCDRKTAKPFIYALLFGGGDAKLGKILTGIENKEAGKKARNALMKGIPGLKALNDKLNNIFFGTKERYGRGCFPGLDGRMVYPGSGHQCLNYLLQTFEGVTCKAALVYAFDKMTEEGIDFYPTMFMHDEIAAVVREDQAERALEIMIEGFIEGPKEFGAMIMGGDGTIGDNYAAVH